MVTELSEAQFQRQVTDLAELHGWEWVHFRPARTAAGWRTPVSGPLGVGWPDLVLLRVHDRRLVVAELKAQRGRVHPDQQRVLDALHHLATVHPYLQVCVWRPSDLPEIQSVLR